MNPEHPVDRQCTHKKRFPSRKAARIAAQKVLAHYGYRCDIYRCPHCGYCHLTRKDPVSTPQPSPPVQKSSDPVSKRRVPRPPQDL